MPQHRDGPTAQYSAHIFERICRDNGIDHRLTRPNHPWTNGQVERMNRSLKEATVRRYYYKSHDQLHAHLAAFVDAYNFAKRLKTLKGLTPIEYICNCWTDPNRFTVDPTHLFPGLNTEPISFAGGPRDPTFLAQWFGPASAWARLSYSR